MSGNPMPRGGVCAGRGSGDGTPESPGREGQDALAPQPLAGEPDPALLAELVSTRRDLHRIPELDDDLPRTLAYLRQALEGLGCAVSEPCPSALAAFFDLGREETLAVRADMDALPIDEATGAPYASGHPGRMHACGHDGHMTMALACARWVDALVRGGRANELAANVLFVFQPAEETTGGARRVCESGVFEATRTRAVFGFHLWPDLPLGAVASRPGALLARSSETTISFHGRSSHIAKWAEGRDALMAAARFLVAAREAEARLAGAEPCLLRFGRLEAGTVRNAVAGEARLEGSLRVFSDAMFDRATAEVERLAREAAGREGCTADAHFSAGYPPVVNDPALFSRVRERVGGVRVLDEPLLIAEDFSFYQRRLPGVFLLLGTGTGIPLHADTFDFDERVLAVGLGVYQRLLTR